MMRSMTRVLFAALLLVLSSPAWAGCLSGPDQTASLASVGDVAGGVRGPVQIIQDPQGDAGRRIDSVGPVYLYPACDAVNEQLPPPVDLCWETMQQLYAQARPAPELDVVGISITESPAELLVDLEIAEVGSDLRELAASDTRTTTGFIVCLTASDEWDCFSGERPTLVVMLFVMHWGGEVALLSLMYSFDPDGRPCSVGVVCWTVVPVEPIPGTPGAIRWTVPRGLVPGSEKGDVLRSASVWVDEISSLDLAPLPDAALWLQLPPGSPLPLDGLYLSSRDTVWGGVDWLKQPNADPIFAFETEPRTLEDAPNAMLVDDGALWEAQGDEPALDVLSMGLIETPAMLVFTNKLAGLGPDSPGFGIVRQFAFRDGPLGLIDARLEGSEATAEAVECRASEDENGAMDCGRTVPATIEIEYGEPAWVNLTVQRDDFAALPAGALLTSHVGLTGTRPEMVGLGPARVPDYAEVGPAWASVHYDWIIDFFEAPLHPFATHYASGPDGGTSSEGAALHDATGDLSTPLAAALEPGAAAGFDITSVRVDPSGDGSSTFQISLRGAAPDAPPWYSDGYAIVAAVKREEGSVVVGYYRGLAAPEGEFFCAPDMLVYPDRVDAAGPQDPGAHTRTELDGRTIAVPRERGANEPTDAAFLITVPHDLCFGTDPASPVEASSLGAGSYLVQGTARGPDEPEVFEMDRADGFEALSLAGATPAPGGAWYRNSVVWLVGLVALLVLSQVVVLVGRRRHAAVVASDAARDAYRAMVQDGVAGGASTQELMTRLKPMRRTMGISDREHAHIEGEVRTMLAGTTGVARGLVPGELFLDRYQVVRLLAAGGAAQTYLCNDVRLDRQVVFKVLRTPGGADDLSPVLREARAFARVRHPNVVTLHDIEAVGDEAYLVLELVDGGSLFGRLVQGPLAPPGMLRLADDLLAGLAAVHAAGIVHRDVKPGNVLVTSAGRFKLADFGIAHLPGYEQTIAGLGAGAAIGTLRYMSPEQARGEAVDARSDLYSAALTLYEAWTGVPFLAAREGDSFVDVQLRAASGQGSLDACNGATRLRAFFERALAVEPSERFPSADRMRVALLDALRGAETPRRAPVRMDEKK